MKQTMSAQSSTEKLLNHILSQPPTFKVLASINEEYSQSDLGGGPQEFSEPFQDFGDTDYLLTLAYDHATQFKISPVQEKILRKYHKCLYALIKVFSERIQKFYEIRFRQNREYKQLERQFSEVLAKIMTKMKEIEVEAQSLLGGHTARLVLLPFTQVLKPITKILGIS